MPKVDRLTRVNELIKRELADQIERSNLLSRSGMLLSVTEVNSSVDLHNATVRVSIFGGDDAARGELFHELHRARPALQKAIAQHLAFKFTPILNFVADDRMAKGDHILELLNKSEHDKQS